jgi:DNA-binding LacI/PurR family transcriptional regulator
MYSDAMAILACNALVKHGLTVPRDISVVGHEGVVLHEYGYVKLTTVTSPVERLGRTAVQMLRHQIDTGEPAPSQLLAPRLDVFESTAPPPHGV